MKTPAEIKAEINRFTTQFYSVVYTNQGMKGALIGLLNDACGGDEERHRLLRILFGKSSSKHLTGAEWVALLRWASIQPVADGWLPHGEFYEEVKTILDEPAKRNTYEFD